MRKSLPYLFILGLLVGCSDDTPESQDYTAVSFVNLNQSSTVVTSPNPPAGSTDFKTYETKITIAVPQEKRLSKVNITSLRINVLNYNCDRSEIPSSLFYNANGSATGIIFSLNENSELELGYSSNVLDRVEEVLKSGKQAELEFHTTLPSGVVFDLQVGIVMNATLVYAPF